MGTKIYSRVVIITLLVLLNLQTTISAVAPETLQKGSYSPPTSPVQPVTVSEPVSLAGSYRLRLPGTLFRIRKNVLTIKLCNTFRFNMIKGSLQNSLRFELVSSTQKACTGSLDQLYVDYITSISAYWMSDNRVHFLKDQEVLISAEKKQDSPAADPLEGSWLLVPSNLSLEVSEQFFVFYGCNTVTIGYKATSDGKITFNLAISTLKACDIDTDALFIASLQKSTSYTKGVLTFELYDKKGEKTAYGTPYMY